jgi:hypothetical protein
VRDTFTATRSRRPSTRSWTGRVPGRRAREVPA